ncbi:glutathione S-transferase [Penicillium concentricum]|uniref:Glutathione S-transferase n=1 Tax=Penicillium concentricum TaxID=293559 RepID=A0A9W9V903_9EURO|nr:glutathione S-transferase [Penicillium concentricum]KAJ5372024.1 glutathione S-transferase [Penicillium concentricum]
MSSDITLYTWNTANGIKASITLEELGLSYKTELIDIGSSIQKEEWFLKINPNGRIPALIDGPQRVFESGSIMLYLVNKYDTDRKISYAPGTPEYIEQVSWLMFQTGGIGPMQGQANHFRLVASVRSDYAIKRYIDETKRLYSVLEYRLKESTYLAGSKYTIADITNYTWVRRGPQMLEIDLSEFPALKNWVDEIDKRAAVQKGADVPHLDRTDEQWNELLRSARAKIDGMTNSDQH